MKKKLYLLVVLGIQVLSTSCSKDLSTPSEEALPYEMNIVGKDNRKDTDKLKNKNYIPRVGKLIQFNDDETMGECTASLISKNFVITSAHCVMSVDNEIYTNSYFYPGVKRSYAMPYDRYPVKRVFFPQKFSRFGAFGTADNDIAIVELGESHNGKTAGVREGFFGIWGREQFPTSEIMAIGYPGDKMFSHQYFEEGCLAKAYDKNTLIMNCDVIEGQSGSAILVYSEKHKTHFIQALLSGYVDDISYATRITKERQRIIVDIIDNGAFTRKYSEKWKIVDMPVKKTKNIIVKNNCKDQVLYYAVSVRRNKKVHVEGYYQIDPETASFPPIETNASQFYLSAVSGEMELITRKDKHFFISYEQQDMPFQKYQMKPSADQVIEFGCQ